MKHKAKIKFWLDYFASKGVPEEEAKKLANNPDLPQPPTNPHEVLSWQQ